MICFGVAAASVLTSLCAPMYAKDFGWVQGAKGWQYYSYDEPVKNDYILIDGDGPFSGDCYAFDQNGYMITNNWFHSTKFDHDEWYYLQSSGKAVQNGWQKVHGNWYYFDYDFTMITGWADIDDETYYFDQSGAMARGWRKVDGFWYFFNQGGALQKDKKIEDGALQYAVDANGRWVRTYHMNGSYDVVDYSKPNASHEKDLYGFLGWLASSGDEDAANAIKILRDPNAYQKSGQDKELNYIWHSDYTGMSLDNVLRALDLIDECNALRRKDGLAALKVNSSMMAVAQVQNAWGRHFRWHSNAYPVGENLHWVKEPFHDWYDVEKERVENGVTEYVKIGHYLNIVNDSYEITGYAVTDDYINSQVFDNGSSYTGGLCLSLNPVSVSAYRSKIQQYLAG